MNERLSDVELPTESTAAESLPRELKEEYRSRLSEKLKDPEFRKIEGFPLGTDEAILALSDPPFYTACPNPFLGEWLAENAKSFNPETDSYHREPFAADVSEGKNHPIYNAHSYHTKVPHRAIMRYILHYTEPGDLVYDGFCGTGMTGVAAQLCGDRQEIEALGADPKNGKPGDYVVDRDGTIWERSAFESERALSAGHINPHSHLLNPKPISKVGRRKVILNDLSPVAAFIAYNYNSPVDLPHFEREARQLLEYVQQECGWMYTTLHREPNKWSDSDWADFVKQAVDGLSKCITAEDSKDLITRLSKSTAIGELNYIVWSDVFTCPSCGGELILWHEAVDGDLAVVRDSFPCPHCFASTTKQRLERKFASRFDTLMDDMVVQAIQVPVVRNYAVESKRYQNEVNDFDLAMIAMINRLTAKLWIPTTRMPEGQETRRNDPIGLTHVHHFFTQRNLCALSAYAHKAKSLPLLFLLSGVMSDTSKLARVKIGYYYKGGGGPFIPGLSGTLYIPSFSVEKRVGFALENRLDTVIRSKQNFIFEQDFLIQCGSASTEGIVEKIDYIFTDPPFGGNLNYSELNFLIESWLKLVTNPSPEAITNSVRQKGLPEYQSLMTECFRRYYEALKPARWMTVEFHNSADIVWNAIHEALDRVGFVVADVRVIDKQQYSFKQVTTSGATKKDLVISCYKPSERFLRVFEKHKGETEGAKEFLDQHLSMLPVAPLTPNGKLEQIAERTLGVLYDRMIAYHLVHNVKIPLSATQFGKLLSENYILEDGMWFLPEQVGQYLALKMRGAEPEQLTFYMQDEKSAVRWIGAELGKENQTLGELTPKFMRELKEWPKTEPRPELRELLKEYFIPQVDGTWKIPDPNSEEDLAHSRREAMLKLFKTYATEKTKLGTFRKEAMIEGFKYCWDRKQFGVIVKVCQRIKPSDLQADRELLQFYDIAKDMVPADATGQLEMVWD